jgi:hypothetical protein
VSWTAAVGDGLNRSAYSTVRTSGLGDFTGIPFVDIRRGKRAFQPKDCSARVARGDTQHRGIPACVSSGDTAPARQFKSPGHWLEVVKGLPEVILKTRALSRRSLQLGSLRTVSCPPRVLCFRSHTRSDSLGAFSTPAIATRIGSPIASTIAGIPQPSDTPAVTRPTVAELRPARS